MNKTFEQFCADLTAVNPDVKLVEAKALYEKQNVTPKVEDGYTRCETVGQLKTAIKNLPDDMPVGRWSGSEGFMYDWANGAPSTVYVHGNFVSIYGNYDDENPLPSVKMLVL